MLYIKFEYRDQYTNGKWSQQECFVESLQKCREFYGLGIDSEFHIISIEEV